MYLPRISCTIFLLVSLASADRFASAMEKQEETYSISLVQSADTDKEVREIEGKRIVTERYQVRPGDYLWKILREKNLLRKQSLQEVLQLLKALNPSLKNIDLLHPGETLAIPLSLTPRAGLTTPPPKPADPPVPVKTLREVDLEQYIVKPGDSLIRVIKSKYNISDADIHDEYIDLLKRFNPDLTSVNAIRPGQKIRLPVYSPQVVRMPLPPPPGREESPPPPPSPTADASDLMAQVSECLREMGLEWVDAGQHFIPLKSGGQITLNADTFPILQIPSGVRVVLDCRGGLPERMASLITSSWSNYRIVRIGPKDTLREAIGRVLAACGFPKVYKANEPLDLPGDVPLRLKGDWIVHTIGDDLKGARYVSLTLVDPGVPRIPAPLKDLLESMGVRAVEYPVEKSDANPPVPAEPIKVGSDLREVVERVLRLSGIPFSQDVEIPVFQGGKSPFNLTVKADFLLSREGSEKIIDLTGLGPEIVALLREHRFEILTLEQRPPLEALPKVLEFLGIPFDGRPHTFLAADRGETRNLSMTLQGVQFSSADGRKILASPIHLPLPLSGFLSTKGYTVIELVETGPRSPVPGQ